MTAPSNSHRWKYDVFVSFRGEDIRKTFMRKESSCIKENVTIIYNYFSNCPNLFKNVSIDSEGSISKKTECVDSSITSQGSIIHQLSAFLGYLGIPTNNNRCEFFSQDNEYSELDIIYHGNSSSIPEWFRNRSLGENHVKVDLPSEEDWCFEKLRGYGTCVVFKRKKLFSKFIKGWYSVKNFDGAYLMTEYDMSKVIEEYMKKEEIGIQEESYIIWLHYTTSTWDCLKQIIL